MKKNIFLAVVIFLAGIFLAFSVQAQSHLALEGGAKKHSELFETEAVTANHVMALYPPPPDCPTVPPHVTSFVAGQQAMNWAYVTGALVGDPYNFEWYAPDSQQFSTVGSIPSSGNWCLFSFWEQGIPNIPGSWLVDFFYNGVFQYRDNFQVTAPPGWSAVYDKLFADDEEALETLRRFRDEVLRSNPYGTSYVDRLYDRSHEVALILLLNPALRGSTSKLLSELVPKIESILEGEDVQLSKSTVRKIHRLLDAFEIKSSPELRNLIKDVRAALENQATMRLFGISLK